MKISPYLGFAGRCAEAFRFYEECLGGKQLQITTNGQSPMASQMPVEMHNLVMHARILIGDTLLMGGDAPTGAAAMSGFCVALSVDQPEDAERIFGALSEGGTVQMPIGETFWAHRFGMAIDRFGTPWMVNCEKPMA